MSYRNKREQGHRLPYNARTGVGGFPPLKGMDLELDPGAIDDNDFTRLENVRINPDGIIESRGGQGKLSEDSLAGCIEGIFEAGPQGEPVPVGGSSPDPHRPPPIPPGGIVTVILNPRGGGFYNPSNDEVAGWATFSPLEPWQALKDNNHNTNVALAGAVMTYITCLFDMIPEVPGTTPLTSLIIRVDPLVVGGTDANGFWQTGANLYIRARLAGVDLDSTAFTPITDQHIIEYISATKPGGGTWTIADINAAEFGFAIDGPFTPQPPNSQPYVAKLWGVAIYNG